MNETHKLHMVSQALLINSPLGPIPSQITLWLFCELSSQRLFPNSRAEVSDWAVVRGWWWWPCCL